MLDKFLEELVQKLPEESMESMVSLLADKLAGEFIKDRFTISVYDLPRGSFYSKHVINGKREEFRHPLDRRCLARYVLTDRRPLMINDLSQSEQLLNIDQKLDLEKCHLHHLATTPHKLLMVPIQKVEERNAQGVLEIYRKKGEKDFDESDLKNMQFLAASITDSIKEKREFTGPATRWSYLVQEGDITLEELEKASELARTENCSVDQILRKEFYISLDKIGESLHHYFRVPYTKFDPSRYSMRDKFPNLDPGVLKHQGWVPIDQEGDRIVVLMEDPKDIPMRDFIRDRISENVLFHVGTRDDVLSYIKLFSNGESRTSSNGQTGNPIDQILKEVNFADPRKKIAQENFYRGIEREEETSESASLIIRLVNQIINQGYEEGASDIHIECSTEREVRVRFRIDGVCYEFFTLPQYLGRAIISRLKIMAGLDIAERRLPQDGKIKHKNFGSYDIELRLATMPKVGGVEDAVLRILSSSEPLPLESLGMRSDVYSNFVDLIEKPYGIILCVGPTGSGKTTTLHAALRHINSPSLNILTAEDPVEITQDGLRQLQVNPKIGLTFDRAMRSFLRMDPDVIMVGEMRDYETISTAIKASLTGHLVFSTLHTNSAPETITRLLDMEIDPFFFAESLLGIQAQRLVRKLCEDCRERMEVTDEEMEQFRNQFGNPELFDREVPDRDQVVLYRAKGCNACHQSGYRGRTAIHELMPKSPELRELIQKKAPASELRDTAQKQGMLTLKQDGILKVLNGVTDLPQVNRVCM